MAKHSIYLYLLLFLTACAGSDGTDKPDDLIDADQMADILTEVHLAEAQVGRYTLSSADSSSMMFNRLNEKIMNKFEVDTSSYRRSYIYYSANPDQFEKIYKNVTGQLQELTKSASGSATAANTRPGASTPGTSTPTAPPTTTGQATLSTATVSVTSSASATASTTTTPASGTASRFLSRRPILRKP